MGPPVKGSFLDDVNGRAWFNAGGQLFFVRYKSMIVDGSGPGYLKSVCDYAHLNPARAKLVAEEGQLRSFAWNIWPAYPLASSKRPAWLLGYLGLFLVFRTRGGYRAVA